MSTDLSRRLAKLESTHKRILRCPLCRYSLSDIPPKRRKRYAAEPASVLATKCWHCGTQYLIPLPRSDEHFRQAADLHYNSHPTKHFTDECVHAADSWLELSSSQKAKYEKEREKAADRPAQPRVARSPLPPVRGPLTLKERKEKEAREELKQRAQEFIRARQEYFKRRADGPESFPLDETIKALDADRVHAYSKVVKQEIEALGFEKYGEGVNHYRSQTVTIKNAILTLRKREACEVVIWGKALPDTVEEIAFFEALLPKVVEEAAEKDREEKEKKARETAERQRQHEEYLARTRSQQSVNVQPVKPQSANPDHDNLLRDLMGETAYNAMREAQALGRDNRPTTAQGRRLIEIPYIPPEQESEPPPNDGTLDYQQKLAHWRKTGVWPPDPWQRTSY
jgi:hypothetical protein